MRTDNRNQESSWIPGGFFFWSGWALWVKERDEFSTKPPVSYFNGKVLTGMNLGQRQLK